MTTPGNPDTQQNDGCFTWFETTVNGGVTILSLIRDAAAVAPVPYLKQAAGLTVNIIGIIQSVKDNKSDFRRLGRDAASLLIAVLVSYDKSENQADWPGERLQGAVDNLIETLVSIQSFAQKQLDRGLLVRILNYLGDGRKIKEYRETLTEATNRFGLSSQLEASDLLRTINLKLKDFLRDPQEGNKPNPRQQRSLDYLVQWKQKADLLFRAEREPQGDFSDEKGGYQQPDIRSKKESKKKRKSDSEDSLHGPPGWNNSPPPQQLPQYLPWVPPATYIGMPMPTGGPVHLTNINSGNVTTKIQTNVGNNNSTVIKTVEKYK